MIIEILMVVIPFSSDAHWRLNKTWLIIFINGRRGPSPPSERTSFARQRGKESGAPCAEPAADREHIRCHHDPVLYLHKVVSGHRGQHRDHRVQHACVPCCLLCLWAEYKINSQALFPPWQYTRGLSSLCVWIRWLDDDCHRTRQSLYALGVGCRGCWKRQFLHLGRYL